MNYRPLALLASALLAGCISTGFEFVTEEDQTAGYTETITDPVTNVSHVKVYEPRRKITRRRGNYLNNTGAGNAISGALQDFGGVGGILGSLGTGGLLGVGAGGLGILGLIGKMLHSNAKLAGKEAGWDDREKAASVQAPLPGTVTATASTTGATLPTP